MKIKRLLFIKLAVLVGLISIAHTASATSERLWIGAQNCMPVLIPQANDLEFRAAGVQNVNTDTDRWINCPLNITREEMNNTSSFLVYAKEEIECVYRAMSFPAQDIENIDVNQVSGSYPGLIYSSTIPAGFSDHAGYGGWPNLACKLNPGETFVGVEVGTDIVYD